VLWVLSDLGRWRGGWHGGGDMKYGAWLVVHTSLCYTGGVAIRIGDGAVYVA
jgi:hypothetical protein